jgi:hypothetical protein
MSILRKKYTKIYAALQAAKGTAATLTGDNAQLWLNSSGFIQAKSNQVSRELGPVGAWPSQLVTIGSWGEGGHDFELKGSGTPGVEPRISPYLETLLGTKYVGAADVVNGVGTTTTLTATSESYNVGQLIRVAIGTGYEVRRITAVSGQDLTVQRAFSEAPADGAEICAGVTYLHLGTEAVKYMTVDQYLESVRLYCPDTAAMGMEVTIDAREVIKAAFTLQSLTCTPSATANTLTPSYEASMPLGGVLCNLVRENEEYEVKAASFSLTTRRTRGGINSGGYSELPWLGTFDASVSLSPWVEDIAILTEYLASSSVTAEMTKGTTAGNIFHAELAELQHSGPDIGEDEGDLIWNDDLTVTGGMYFGLF